MKKKILFVNDEMRMGGVARILLDLINKLDTNEYDIDIFLLHPHGDLLAQIPNNIEILPSSHFFDVVDVTPSEIYEEKNIGKFLHKLLFFIIMKFGLMPPIVRFYRKKLIKEKYDIEFSAKEGFCTMFVAEGNANLKLNWVQVDYKVHNYAKHHQKLLINALNKIDLNIASSEQAANSFRELFNCKNIQVIHNFIDTDAVKNKSLLKLDEKKYDQFHYITVARFHPQKSVDRLIKAFNYVYQHNKNCFLTIIGDGEQRELIEKLIVENNLNNCVELLGMKNNPYPYMRVADCFVLSSLYEGYATIVIESLAVTTPVLATRVSGIIDQIRGTEMGWIVENDLESLQRKMLEISYQKNEVALMKRKLEDYKYFNDEIMLDYKKVFNLK